MATAAQINYIESLTKRLKKAVRKDSPTYPHIMWGIRNCESMTTADAGKWIDHLRTLIRTCNEVEARFSTNGRGRQI